MVSVVAMFVLVFVLAIAIFMVVAMWKIYVKANQPGWACIIPLYNIYIMTKIAGVPAWYLIGFFLPVVNLVVVFLMYNGIAKKFGKGVGFAIGMIFLSFIFIPILGFGNAQYEGRYYVSNDDILDSNMEEL